MTMCWRAVTSVLLFCVALTAGPAEAARKPHGVACQRSDQLSRGGALTTQHVAAIARHHCETNSTAAESAELRLKKEWAEPRKGQLCNLINHGYAAPGSEYEQIEAECVVSWVEYSLYAKAHPSCLDDINAAMREWIDSHSNMLNRLDVREICPDAKFGAEEPDPKGEADRRTDRVVMGAFGIGGWLCCGIVVFVVIAGFGVGVKYERA